LSKIKFFLDTSETKEKDNLAFEEYIKKNNIIVANNMNTFNTFKKVLVQQNENYELFDYTEYSDHICKIQAAYMAYKARRKYKIFRYVVRKIISAQKYIRSLIIRKKFERYRVVTKNVTIIQKVYKTYFRKKLKAIIFVQRFVKALIKRTKGDLLSKSDSRKEEVNLKLQEQLFQASAKDQEKRKIQKPIVQKKNPAKRIK